MKNLRLLGIIVIICMLINNFISIKTVKAEPNLYEGYKVTDEYPDFDMALYAQKIGDNSVRELVYCFNITRDTPNNLGVNPTIKYKKVKGLPQTLFSLADDPRYNKSLSSPLREKEFKKNILRIIYNGYPLNKSGFKGSLSDGKFRAITQYAIWYYTDSMNMNDYMSTTEEKEVFNKLINSKTEIPENFMLDIFESIDEDYQNLLNVKIYEDTILRKIKFSKTNIDGKELAGAKIEIHDDKGTKLHEWISTDTEKTIELKPGNYIFHEEAAPQGYLKVTDIEFSVTQDGKVEITKKSNGDQATTSDNKLTVIDQNKPITKKEVRFSKRDIAGNELVGAQVQILKDGQEIESWTSGKTPKVLELEPGEYVFRETMAPQGYEIATEITFTINEDGTATSKDINAVQGDNKNIVVMIDDYIFHDIVFSKTDIGGKELAGAKIEIHDDKGTKLHEWVSTDTEKTIELKPGNYIFHEEAAPQGYLKVTDIEFTVTQDGKVEITKKSNGDQATTSDNKLTVIDQNEPITKKEVRFSKRDIAGNELVGAQVQILKDGQEIESWTSGKTPKVLELEPGEYVFRETMAPQGYEIATEITFTINEDGTATSKNINAVQGDNKNIVVMIDDYIFHDIVFSKTDIGGKELAGAKIEIHDDKGTKLHEWISTDTEKTIELKPGNYIFHEEAAPQGYLKVTDIEFTVTKDGKVEITKKANEDQAATANNKLTVVDKNEPIKIKMPNTGSNFILFYMISGLVITITMLFIFFKKNRRYI